MCLQMSTEYKLQDNNIAYLIIFYALEVHILYFVYKKIFVASHASLSLCLPNEVVVILTKNEEPTSRTLILHVVI